MPIQPHKNNPIYGLILLTFALTLHALAADSFWGDEILTALIAQQPPAEIIHLTAADIHPPFYYLLVKGWAYLTLNPTQPTIATDWLWRFPSIVVTVLTVTLTYKLTPYLLPKKHALAVALLIATAPTVIKYSQEARMHALFMGLSLLTTWLLMQALRHHRWPYWVAFACATALNLYTVYFGFLILASQMLFVGLLPSPRPPSPRPPSPRPPSPQPSPKGRGGDKNSLSLWERAGVRGHFALAVMGATTLYSPWLFVLTDILRHRATVGAIEGGVGSPWLFLSSLVAALGPMPAPIAWLFFSLYLLGLLSLIRQQAWPQAALIATWLGLPALLPLLLGDPRALQFRYDFVIPIYFMGVVQGLSALVNGVQTFRFARLSSVKPEGLHSKMLWQYSIWLLTTVSFLATLTFYQQTKPDWRAAATYLDNHARASDLILIGPLWDEGRFIGYYYRGQAQLLTPAAFVTNIERYAQSMRQNNGRLWAINNFTPIESPFATNHEFEGVVLSEPKLNVYEATVLTQVALNLARQAVDGAYPWAEAARAQGVINPDPRTAKAAALKAVGDTLMADQQLPAAIAAYQEAVAIFPGWVGGFMALAEAQEMAGHLPESAQAYQQAVAFNLKWQGAPANQATNFIRAGQWAEAIELYHQITK